MFRETHEEMRWAIKKGDIQACHEVLQTASLSNEGEKRKIKLRTGAVEFLVISSGARTSGSCTTRLRSLVGRAASEKTHFTVSKTCSHYATTLYGTITFTVIRYCVHFV